MMRNSAPILSIETRKHGRGGNLPSALRLFILLVRAIGLCFRACFWLAQPSFRVETARVLRVRQTSICQDTAERPSPIPELAHAIGPPELFRPHLPP